jgi:SAM-dependent methyltransferase
MIGKKYEYEAMAECEQHLWWYRCLHDLTLKKIKENSNESAIRVLDAGCGTGGLLLYLKKNHFTDIEAFDLSPDAVAFASATSGIKVSLHDITKPPNYPCNYFDIVISHDILCLLPAGEDEKALYHLLEVLKPGGILLMNLPALNAFRGTHDIAVGIKKRYSAKKLQKLLGEYATIIEAVYWPFLLSPPVFLMRSLQRLAIPFIHSKTVVSDVKMPSALLNDFFYRLTSVENRYIKNKPWGSSLMAVVQKKPDAAII